MHDVVKMIKNGMFLSILFIKMEKRHNKDITERKMFWILLTECLLLVKVKIFQKYIYIFIYIFSNTYYIPIIYVPIYYPHLDSYLLNVGL